MDDTKLLILKVLSKQKSDLIRLSNAMDRVVNIKSAEASEASRKYSNELYSQKNLDDKVYKEIFAHYCKSITTAPNGSEQLSLALADRSAFLLDMKRYKDCIRDTDKALVNMIGSNFLLKIKLLCRKAECLKKLGLLMYLDVLKEAECCMDKIDETSKEACEILIDRIKKLPSSKKPIVADENNSLPETEDTLSHISINYTDNYGRHLVAAKDYEPGDIIFVEKLYATNVGQEKSWMLCNYCLKYAWSGVPCEQCDWAIFCSEECKLKAWREFHDVECTLIPHLKILEKLFLPYYNISLRLLILGLRETGGIAALKQVLKNVDECQDNCSRGFYKNGKFSSKSIESIYSLKCDGLSENERATVAFAVIMILIGIIKYSNLIEDFEIKEIDDLMKNEDILFLGFLLLKLIEIKNANSFSLSDNKNGDCEKSNKPVDCMIKSCCARGSGLSTLGSLLNHSCFPNAKFCFTEDLKIVVYALQPIKKSSQIFTSYSVSFYISPLAQRQMILEKYKFNCDCEACKQCWPPLLMMTKEELAQENCSIKDSNEQKIYIDCTNILKALCSQNDTFDKNCIAQLSKIIIQIRALKQPSLLMSVLMEALNTVFSLIYGMKSPSFDKSKP